MNSIWIHWLMTGHSRNATCFPLEVKISKKKTEHIEEDEGITPATSEGLAGLKPVEPGGVLTYGSQTHPADGNCGFIVTIREKAKELSKNPDLEIKIISYGYSREDKAKMAAAPVPAAEMALSDAGLNVKDIKVIKTHNPFIVNDLNMAKKDEYRCYGNEQLWKLIDIRPSTGPDSRKAYMRINRRTCSQRWGVRLIYRLCSG